MTESAFAFLGWSGLSPSALGGSAVAEAMAGQATAPPTPRGNSCCPRAGNSGLLTRVPPSFHFLLPAVCAVLYVLAALTLKRASGLGVGVWRTSFPEITRAIRDFGRP